MPSCPGLQAAGAFMTGTHPGWSMGAVTTGSQDLRSGTTCTLPMLALRRAAESQAQGQAMQRSLGVPRRCHVPGARPEADLPPRVSQVGRGGFISKVQDKTEALVVKA